MNTSTSTKNFLAGLLAYAVMFGPVSALLAAPIPAMASDMFVTLDSISSQVSTGGAFDSIAPAATPASSSFTTTDSVTSATTAAASSNLSSTSSTSSGSSNSLTTTTDVANKTASAEASTSLTTTTDVASSTLAAASSASSLTTTADVASSTLAAEAAKSSLTTTDQVIDLTKCAWDAGHTSIGYYVDGIFGINGCPQSTSTPTYSISISVPANMSFTKGSAAALAFNATGTTGVVVTDTFPGASYSLVCTSAPSYNANVSGVYTITCVATDAGGQKATGTYTVTVTDSGSTSTIPTLSVGSDITVTKATATSTYTTSANVTVNQNASTSTVTVVCTPATINNQMVGSTNVSCVGNYASSTTNTVTYKYTVTDTTTGGGSTSTIPTLTAGPDISVVKGATTTPYTTTNNVTINHNGSTSTVTVVCTPASVDNSIVGSTNVSCVGNYASSTTNTVTYKYTVTDTTTGGGGSSTHGGGSSGGSSVIGSRANPTGEVLGLSTDEECSYLEEYLRIGYNNNPAEVLKLQAFLKVYERADVDVTGFFDMKTDSAVRAFQVKYKTDVLTPWALPGSTGYVYYTTKKKINEIRCDHEYPLTAQQRADIAAYKLAMSTINRESAHVAQAAAGSVKTEVSTGSINSINNNSGSVANNSLQVGSEGATGFWAKIKNGLFAALGMFTSKKSEKTVDASAATSTSKKDDSKAGGVAAKDMKKNDAKTASAGASNNPLLSTFAALIAIAFGVLAFAMAAYLYRRTRGDDEVAIEETLSV